MKRIVAIPLLFLILISGIRVQIASHYCGGNYIGSKVSLNGEKASCGMEPQNSNHSSESLIKRHCCEDVITSLSISTNFVPSTAVPAQFSGQETIPISLFHSELFAGREAGLSLMAGILSPPGALNRTGIEQQVLCIFRI
jgi:hypothetical protein